MNPDDVQLIIVLLICIASAALGWNVKKWFDDWGKH